MRVWRPSIRRKLDSNIFQVSPLLGCYYLANSTTSNVLNILCDNILMDNWMLDAETNKKKHLDPLIKDSQRFIDKSRYVLSPIRQDKGMYVERGYFEKKKDAPIYRLAGAGRPDHLKSGPATVSGSAGPPF